MITKVRVVTSSYQCVLDVYEPTSRAELDALRVYPPMLETYIKQWPPAWEAEYDRLFPLDKSFIRNYDPKLRRESCRRSYDDTIIGHDWSGHSCQHRSLILAYLVGIAFNWDAKPCNFQLRRLQEREAFGRTAYGKGWAFPHVHHAPVEQTHLAIMRFASDQGIDFRAADRKPVHLVCCILHSETESISEQHTLFGLVFPFVKRSGDEIQAMQNARLAQALARIL